MTDSALSDLLILDLSRVLAGPFCTMLLADYGAEVIKVERPGRGDGTRAWGPPWIGEESAYFLSANRNKKSMTVNLKTVRGQAIVRALAVQADVVIENFKPGTTERLKIDYERLSAENPGLVYCSISGYGQDGPYRDRPGYDFMIQAQGGIMSITGPREGPPYKVGVAIVDVTAGLYAANAILTALHERQRSGRGQYIDVALFDSQLSWLVNVAQNYFATGEAPQRYGNAHPNIVPYESFATADGHIALAIGRDAQFRRFCELAQCDELWQDERFQTNAGRVAHRADLIGLLQEVMRQRPTEEWLALLAANGVPAGPINDIPSALNDPQAQARGMVRQIEHETAGTIQLLGPVAKLSRTPGEVRSAPPTLGAHTKDILAQRLGYHEQQIAELRDEGVI
ncbi:MAG TPA: CaiB/BaiF CoA-transferase family protein [Candidatus Sulfomarinibacteraceae bacterium]|nr:CaiB/BaiF CoA-transferase family protein [Candidatus Sulfomarinibacteraceae bacterium]